MSADIDRIGSSMTLLHEIYASFIDGALAIYLLYWLIGIAVVPPLVWIIGMIAFPFVVFCDVIHYRILTAYQSVW